MPLTTHPRNPNQTYGPTNRGHFYISKEDHRKTAAPKKDKTRWCIREGEEYCVFKIANEGIIDEENNQIWWYCEDNDCLFGFVFENDRLLKIGENEEQIAKFPNDRNEHDPWHGYPVSTEESQNRPSSELLDRLEECGCISDVYRLRIEKGRI